MEKLAFRSEAMRGWDVELTGLLVIGGGHVLGLLVGRLVAGRGRGALGLFNSLSGGSDRGIVGHNCSAQDVAAKCSGIG
jgi:hypothetical protein